MIGDGRKEIRCDRVPPLGVGLRHKLVAPRDRLGFDHGTHDRNWYRLVSRSADGLGGVSRFERRHGVGPRVEPVVRDGGVREKRPDDGERASEDDVGRLGAAERLGECQQLGLHARPTNGILHTIVSTRMIIIVSVRPIGVGTERPRSTSEALRYYPCESAQRTQVGAPRRSIMWCDTR